VIWERAVAENAWELDGGLYRILLPLPFAAPFVNVYLVQSRSEYLLIDAGADWLPSLRALGRALKTIGVPPKGLTTLLLTHRHPDHDAGAASVHERWGGQVLVHPLENAERNSPRVTSVDWMTENGVDPETIARAYPPTRERSHRAEPAPPETEDLRVDRPLRLGDLTFDVLLAPGHSPGQVMLREPERGWLFTADHVMPIHGANVWFFPGGEGDPFGEYLASLEQTLPLSASLVLPSHGLPWRGGPREATQGLLDYHRHFASQIHRLLGERTLNAWQIARALNPAIPADPVGIRFSLAEVLAVLIHLEREGTVRHEPNGRWQAS
jgi:glyoxylase-like metal-dependent hydrolase (beta-lactamase superfamily II)